METPNITDGITKLTHYANVSWQNITGRQHPSHFRTKLRFEPAKLSTGILKKYLRDVLQNEEIESLLIEDPPTQYTTNATNLTNFQVLQNLSSMSVKLWKGKLRNAEDIEQVYLDDETIAQDSLYYYEQWKIIHDEIGNHEKQVSFFRILSQIVGTLEKRHFVDIETDGTLRDVPTKSLKLEKQISSHAPNIPMSVEKREVKTPIPAIRRPSYVSTPILKKDNVALETPSLKKDWEIQMESCASPEDEQSLNSKTISEPVLTTGLWELPSQTTIDVKSSEEEVEDNIMSMLEL